MVGDNEDTILHIGELKGHVLVALLLRLLFSSAAPAVCRCVIKKNIKISNYFYYLQKREDILLLIKQQRGFNLLSPHYFLWYNV
tara:strand:+ start:264 stop:515 length:252 start_codon:yes stop_codon:yes gene_type:complete